MADCDTSSPPAGFALVDWMADGAVQRAKGYLNTEFICGAVAQLLLGLPT